MAKKVFLIFEESFFVIQKKFFFDGFPGFGGLPQTLAIPEEEPLNPTVVTKGGL